MKKHLRKPLQLTRETVRTLDLTTLSHVGGGSGDHCLGGGTSQSCHTCGCGTTPKAQ